MLVFLIKQILNVRRAIIGRNEPAQLAWGVAFGVLLGIVPHGNLLAVALLLLLLSLRLNHGIATVAAVGTTLIAVKLDPYASQVGSYALTHEDLSPYLASAWQLPFVPWTDMNNTVVTGSFIIGVAALIPIFLLTYPLFHLFAAKSTPVDNGDDGAAGIAAASNSPDADMPVSSQFNLAATQVNTATMTSLEASAIDAAMTGMMEPKIHSSPIAAQPQVVETRIDVIRVGQRKDRSATKDVEAKDISGKDEPMSEALNYLLRQLQDSRQRRAA